MKGFLFMLALLVSVSAFARGKKDEQAYTTKWCASHGGKEGIVYDDKTRPDCVTKTHVFEFDYADKWYEAVGQSLHYSLKSGKKAAIVLILRGRKDVKYWERLGAVVKHYQLPIELHQIGEVGGGSVKEVAKKLGRPRGNR